MRRHTHDSPLSIAADTSDPVLYSRARILVCSLTRLGRSLAGNELCGVDDEGEGEYTADGITAIADLLKTNTTITALECAATRAIPHCQ